MINILWLASLQIISSWFPWRGNLRAVYEFPSTQVPHWFWDSKCGGVLSWAIRSEGYDGMYCTVSMAKATSGITGWGFRVTFGFKFRPHPLLDGGSDQETEIFFCPHFLFCRIGVIVLFPCGDCKGESYSLYEGIIVLNTK